MAFRKVILPVTGAARDAAVTKTALDIAKTFGSWVNAIYVRPDASEVLPYLGEGISAGVVQEILDAAADAAKKSAAAAKAAVQHAAAEAGLAVQDRPHNDGSASITFRTRHGVLSDVLFDEAALADLFVFDGASLPEMPSVMEALEQVLLSARRPVLISPETSWRKLGTKIAIAWDGGLAASHAVTAAMPWLKRASGVEILSAGAGAATQTQMDHLRDYLRLHNVNPVEHALSSGDPGTGAALLDAAQRAGADLLVMGGYGHSRLREMILGGVTRHVLHHATMPVFMAH